MTRACLIYAVLALLLVAFESGDDFGQRRAVEQVCRAAPIIANEASEVCP